MRRRAFLAGAISAITTPVLAGPVHPGRLIIPKKGAGDCAPHQLLENANLSNRTGDLPSGWVGLGNITKTYNDDPDGWSSCTMTVSADREYIANGVITVAGQAYSVGFYLHSNTTTGSVLWTANTTGGGVEAEITASHLDGEGWYATGVLANNSQIVPRWGPGANLPTTTGTFVFSRPFVIDELISGVGLNSPIKLSGPPLGQWIGTDDGDEPEGSCRP